jgi:hypothetical protein
VFLLGLAEALTRQIDSRAGTIFRSAHACRVGNISAILQLKMGQFRTVVGEAGIEPTTPGVKNVTKLKKSNVKLLLNTTEYCHLVALTEGSFRLEGVY